MPENIRALPSLLQMKNSIDVLNEINVPQKFFNRISTGVPLLDEIFGGADMPGILPGCTLLFTGMPGAGKSTMCLQLADLFQARGNSVLYNVGEENKYMVKIAANRIGLNGAFSLGQIEEIDDLVKYAKNTGVEVLFVDSLQSMRDKDFRGGRLLLSVTKKLIRLSKENDVAIFLVGHINKGGMFAGPQELKHDVDAHAHLRLNPVNGNRLFEMQKNRFGPSNLPYEFFLSARGLDFAPAKVEPVTTLTEVGATATGKHELIRNAITSALMANQKLSGYDAEELGLDCSGGFFRGMLRLVVKALQSEGHKVVEKKIDGRTNFWVEK